MNNNLYFSQFHETEVTIPFTLSVDTPVRGGEALRLKGRVDLLVCRDVCIPESHEFDIEITGGTVVEPSTMQTILEADSRLPGPWEENVSVLYDEGAVVIRFHEFFSVPGMGETVSPYFFPAEWGLIEQSAPQKAEKRGNVPRHR